MKNDTLDSLFRNCGKPKCSFCGKSSDEGADIIVGPLGIAICDDCAVQAHKIATDSSDDDMPDVEQVEHKHKRRGKKNLLGSLPTPRELVKILDEHIIGQEDVKKTLATAVYNHYSRIKSIGCKSNNDKELEDVEIEKSNIVMAGPTGCGKTLLAKAVAGEADVPFFSMSGSDFVEMFVGVGASRVRDLFRQAKEKAPCIIFIDEIDAVGRARSNRGGMPSNDERESTLNQLLTEMDGFGTNSGVIILAATNRADILDKALLRAGRFDRQIHVDLPELQDRVEIFQVHLKPLKLKEGLDIKKLARQTPGFSGADIANVCNEAALIAARNGKETVDEQDFNDAVDRIIGGLEKKSKVMTVEEKHSIAIHEAGHATISWHLKYGNPLVKVTIVPRGNALGAAWYMPEERQIVTYQAMCDELCSLLGGRAAEELFIGAISSGAANDLERVTKQAYAMVAYYGMSESLPNVCYYDSTGQEYGFTKPFSEERAKYIDQEISKIIAEQYNRAKQLLLQYQEGHQRLAATLEEREVIFTEDVEQIFGPRQWASRSDELMEQQKETENNANEQ